MRSGKKNPDGSITLATKIETASVDLNRYFRNQDGESLTEIAAKDNITPHQCTISIRNGANMHEAQQLIRLKALKMEGLLQNEVGRRNLRELIPQIRPKVEQLLGGKRTMVEVNKQTGEHRTYEIEDPDVIALGLQLLQKLISMEEKPAASQTTVNINQNNMNVDTGGQGTVELTFEERLAKVKMDQANRVIDTTARPVDEDESIDAEVVDKKGPEWTEF